MSDATSDIGERAITLTASAAKRIAFLREQEQVGDANLRIAVSGGGCSGFQYGLSFDDQTNPDDRVFERDGIAVVVDEVSHHAIDCVRVHAPAFFPPLTVVLQRNIGVRRHHSNVMDERPRPRLPARRVAGCSRIPRPLDRDDRESSSNDRS